MLEVFIKYLNDNPTMVVPVMSAIAIVSGAFIALLSSFLTSQISGLNNLKVEKKKLESSLILKAIDTDDYRKSLDNLQFFLKIGLLNDKKNIFEKKGKLQRVIDGEIDIPIPALRKLTYDIIVSNRNSVFSVNTSVKAKCEININEVKLLIEKIELIMTDKYPIESTFISYIYAGLTKYTNKEKGIWDIEKRSNKLEVNSIITKTKGVELMDLIFTIDRRAISNIDEYWISFEIGQKDSEEDGSVGTSYVHYKEILKLK